MTIPTTADLLAILRPSPDVRAAAAALLALPVPVGPSQAPENKHLVKPRRLLQRAAWDALSSNGVMLVDPPVAWGRLFEGAPDVWTLHVKIRVPRGTPDACGTALPARLFLASILEEAR